MTRARSLPSITSVPISGRAGVAIEAPEIGNVEHAAGQHDAFRQLQGLHPVRRSDALVAALLLPAELGAIGKPGQLRGELLALVLGGGELEREAPVEFSHQRALDAADMVKEGDHALAQAHRHRRHQLDRRAAGRNVDSLQGCSCLFSRMKRPVSSTMMRLWRRRSGAVRLSSLGRGERRSVGHRTWEPARSCGLVPAVAEHRCYGRRPRLWPGGP